MSRDEFVVYTGRSNTLRLQLTEDGVAIAHNTVSKLAVEVGVTVFDSAINPSLFDLSNASYFVLKLGAAGLSTGVYPARLILYDTGPNQDGLVWPEGFNLKVVAV